MSNIKVGDLVEITFSCAPFFFAGDTAVVTEFDGMDWWADFNNQGNIKVHGDGKWCIGTQVPDDFRVIEHRKEVPA